MTHLKSRPQDDPTTNDISTFSFKARSLADDEAATSRSASGRLAALRAAIVLPIQCRHKEEHAEGVALSNAKVAVAGIELAKAEPGVLRSLLLNGAVQPNQESLAQVTSRIPGIVRDVRKRIGDRVQKGDVPAIVESNQSLTGYELKAALASGENPSMAAPLSNPNPC